MEEKKTLPLQFQCSFEGLIVTRKEFVFVVLFLFTILLKLIKAWQMTVRSTGSHCSRKYLFKTGYWPLWLQLVLEGNKTMVSEILRHRQANKLVTTYEYCFYLSSAPFHMRADLALPLSHTVPGGPTGQLWSHQSLLLGCRTGMWARPHESWSMVPSQKLIQSAGNWS